VVINDATAWAQLWREHKANATPGVIIMTMPQVDFSKYTLAAVFLGTSTSGCDAVHVFGAEQSATKTVLSYAAGKPANAEICSAEVRTPMQAVLIPRTTQPVEFVSLGAPTAMATTLLDQTTRSGITTAQNLVIATQAEFDAMWTRHSTAKAPAVDFTKQSVIAIFSGMGVDVCDALALDGVYASGKRALIEYRIAPPAGAQACTKDVKTLAHIVAVPRVEMAYTFTRLPRPKSEFADAGATAQAFNVIEQDDNSAVTEHTELRIMTQEEWAAFWKRHHANLPVLPPLPAVDFTTQSVLAIVAGSSNGGLGCASLQIDSVITSWNGLNVEYSERANSTFAVCQPGKVSRAVIATTYRGGGTALFINLTPAR
ncbi:MAG TPA: hypothetical protein VIT92_12755, partial [Burkholderiaceae bacterium]